MLNDSRLKDSYIAMLHTDMTPERRAELWEKAKVRFPHLAALLLDEFDRSNTEDKSSHDRLLGSTFMFLSLVNALETDPIVSWAQPPANTGRSSFPAFGFLKPLTNK